MNILLLLSFVLSSFSKEKFFNVISGNDQKAITSQRTILEKSSESATDKMAYGGVLIMKNADFQFWPNEKLKSFIEGKNLLEAAIKKESTNVEYRFLRLMIQEKAPYLLGYHSNIKEDAKWVKEHYQSTSKEVKTFIVAYANQSKFLNL
jgi:hypothetical protein